MAVEVEGDEEWLVVGKKKSGKSKQKQAAQDDDVDVPLQHKAEYRKGDLYSIYGSPSMRSIRSGASTKDT